MPPSLTGTAVAITFSTSSADPAPQNVTIPSDATAAFMTWSYWGGTVGAGLLSATLGGNNPSPTPHELAVGSATYGTGICGWFVGATLPASGSRALDVSWDVTPGNGPLVFVFFVKNGHSTTWRAVGSNTNINLNAVTTTIASTSSDFVVKMDTKFTTTPPGTSPGWTSLATLANGAISGKLSSANTPGASSTVCDSENENYSSIVAVSIAEAIAPVSSASLIYYLMNS